MSLTELHDAAFWIDLAVKAGIAALVGMALVAFGYLTVVGLGAAIAAWWHRAQAEPAVEPAPLTIVEPVAEEQ